ncbi:MAG: hypothetical protein HOB92_00185 [Candidatus Cloacimonetes bacterium]|jgi:hypothetical protein|nr:hypothetical protein [Candidatus Cloacimonadota bacterium]
MAKKKKYYVVFEGRAPGVYDTWDDCNAQVHRCSNALHDSFDKKHEAESAYAEYKKNNPDPYDMIIEKFENENNMTGDGKAIVDGISDVEQSIDVDFPIEEVAAAEECEKALDTKLEKCFEELGLTSIRNHEITAEKRQESENDIIAMAKTVTRPVVPPLPEQDKIKSLLEMIDYKIGAIQLKANQYEILKRSIINRLANKK